MVYCMTLVLNISVAFSPHDTMSRVKKELPDIYRQMQGFYDQSELARSVLFDPTFTLLDMARFCSLVPGANDFFEECFPGLLQALAESSGVTNQPDKTGVEKCEKQGRGERPGTGKEKKHKNLTPPKKVPTELDKITRADNATTLNALGQATQVLFHISCLHSLPRSTATGEQIRPLAELIAHYYTSQWMQEFLDQSKIYFKIDPNGNITIGHKEEGRNISVHQVYNTLDALVKKIHNNVNRPASLSPHARGVPAPQ